MAKGETRIIVGQEGDLQFIYDDELIELLCEGEPIIVRASHVEPNTRGQWLADLGPSGGPILGPFPLRNQALAAEVEWLEQNVLV